MTEEETYIRTNIGTHTDATVLHLLISLHGTCSHGADSIHLRPLNSGKQYSVQRVSDLARHKPRIADLARHYATLQMWRSDLRGIPVTLLSAEMLQRTSTRRIAPHDVSMTYAEALVKMCKRLAMSLRAACGGTRLGRSKTVRGSLCRAFQVARAT